MLVEQLTNQKKIEIIDKINDLGNKSTHNNKLDQLVKDQNWR